MAAAPFTVGDVFPARVFIPLSSPQWKDIGVHVPQQVMVPSVRSPHEYLSLAVTALNYPLGGVACPSSFLPQHSMVPSVRSPHERFQPAATALNCPSGGVACP